MIDERDRTLSDLDSDEDWDGETTNPGLLVEDDTDDAEDFFDDSEPCGETGCICRCGEGHVCSCDCARCGDCQQLTEDCQCDDEQEWER